ncbi:MAG: PQQ-binding-like beta-propeller repeat protein, partial [Planctomycetales bacterium]|nr:PQQ-binding-like beta-propeller repeat protein [Planctomycetales bacterium]
WPEDGPELVWKAAGAGRGYSSLAIADGKLFTLGDAPSTAEDDNEYLTCFDLKTGEQLWKTKTGDAWDSGPGDWQSSRSTPTVDGDRVYVLTPHGKLVCCDIGGKVIFTKDLREDFEGDKADGWGYSESVTIDGDRLICVPGRSKNTMVALNKETGDLIWAASRADDRGAGHASVVIAEVGGTRVYVTTTGSGPMGVRADDGKLLWTYDIEKTTAVIPTPIVRDNLVFFSVGYGRGAALLRQVPGDDHTVTIEEVYPLVTSLANKHGGVVLVGDYVYGDSDDRGVPFCADLMTGELKWKSRGSGKNSASVAVADGHLYILYANGVMTLAKTNTGDLEEVGSFKLPGSNDRPSWSHPVIFDGKLYVRQDDEIFCYNVRAS